MKPIWTGRFRGRGRHLHSESTELSEGKGVCVSGRRPGRCGCHLLRPLTQVCRYSHRRQNRHNHRDLIPFAFPGAKNSNSELCFLFLQALCHLEPTAYSRLGTALYCDIPSLPAARPDAGGGLMACYHCTPRTQVHPPCSEVTLTRVTMPAAQTFILPRLWYQQTS